MDNRGEIPTGQLFADLQISYTEVILVDVLGRMGVLTEKHKERRRKNKNIIGIIKKIMSARFSPEDIDIFLEKGFPREVSLEKLSLIK